MKDTNVLARICSLIISAVAFFSFSPYLTLFLFCVCGQIKYIPGKTYVKICVFRYIRISRFMMFDLTFVVVFLLRFVVRLETAGENLSSKNRNRNDIFRGTTSLTCFFLYRNKHRAHTLTHSKCIVQVVVVVLGFFFFFVAIDRSFANENIKD